MSSNQFDLHLTLSEMSWSFNFFYYLRLMIGINLYVLGCLGRYKVTPLHIVDTFARMDRCDIYCGKLVFKRLSLVPEAYYWYILSIFCYLQATCVYTFFATLRLPIKSLKVLSKFHGKRIWGVIRWNIFMFPKSVWASGESYKIS